MGILHSLSQINKNSANFKRWEKEQDSDEAKREILAQKKPPTVQELKNAKDFGKTIVDVVDIMDQHSEDIAENVETATALPMLAIPIISGVVAAVAGWKFILSPANKKYDKKVEEFTKTHGKKIYDLQDKIYKETNVNKNISDHSFLSAEGIEKLKLPPVLKQEAETILHDWKRFYSGSRKNALIATIAAPIAALVTTFVAGNIYATKMQIDGSRVARFQARKILEDPKYFVKYTPEQIEQAKKTLAAESNEKKKLKTDKLKGGMFRGLASIIRDRKAYKEWKAGDQDDSKKVNRPLTPEETISAKKDQEVIQRVVRKINNNAEKYSENMEVASAVLIGGTPILGGLVGGAVSKVLNLLKIDQKIAKNMVYKIADEAADNAKGAKYKAAYEDFVKLDKNASGKTRAFLKFLNATPDIKGFSGMSKLEKVAKGFKQITPVILSNKWGKAFLFGGAGFFVTGAVGALIGLKLQKASARAGRYVAKKELKQNPQNFIGYTKEELASVKEDTNKKPKQGKFKEYIMFLPTVIKQYFEYNRYAKHEAKQERILHDELTKLDVSDEQLKDAKNLQRKVFNTFEKVDDKSQEYSENVEAATEIAQPFVFAGGAMLAVSPLIVFGYKLYKGKITFQTLANKVISVLSGSTNLMKKKFFKNYLNEVADNVSSKAKGTWALDQPLTKVIGGLDLQKIITNPEALTVGEFCDVVLKNSEKMTKDDIQKFVQKIESLPFVNDFMSAKLEILKKVEKDQLVDVLNHLKNTYGHEKFIPEELLKFSLNEKIADYAQKLKLMSPEAVTQDVTKFAEKFDDFSIIRNLDLTGVDKKYLEATLPKIKTIINNIQKEEFKNIMVVLLDEFKENPDKVVEMLRSGRIASVFITPGLRNALIVAGVTWTAFSMTLAYVLESWLADMQLKAGRLGVMKALEDLKDPAYYANIEIETQKNKK